MNASVGRLAFACVLTLSAAATAQDAYQWESHDKRVSSAQTITALGNDLFGDSVSLQTGALSFTVTDVDLPGNSRLPVRFTRSFTVTNSRGEPTNRMLADWMVQLPRLTARFAATTSGTTEWRSGGNSLNRCSNQTAPDVPASLIGIYSQSSFWQGIQLDIPGVASGEMLVSAAGIAQPTDGQTYRWTTDGQLQLRCITSIANGSGEGFIAITPDGTEYRFDRMARRVVPGLSER